MTGELPLAPWSCAVCAASNETPFDAALGATQKFTEDCRVCCRPNLLRITSDDDGLLVEATFDE